MTTDNIPSLASLEYIPYIDASGQLPEQLPGKIGVYAIFDQEKVLQFVGYSRDVHLSLQQHLVRQPQRCYWLKVQTIDRPNRTLLDNIQNAWTAENDSAPTGDGPDAARWTQSIDVKSAMTADERADYEQAQGEEMALSKVLKNAARRVEQQILAELQSRGVQMQIRFNPKLKEKGLLDLK